MGSHVAKFILGNDIVNAKKLSNLIKLGEVAVQGYAMKTFGGDFVIAGGDDMLLQAPSSRFDPDKIEGLRAIYHKVTQGHTVTAGVGNDMVEASKALTTGKNTGKNKTVYWTSDMQEKYERLVADKCNDLLTKCRAQGGMSEAELLDIVRYFYASHHIDRPVDEAIGDVVHTVKKIVYAQRRKASIGKAKKLHRQAQSRRSLARDMEKHGFTKLADRMHQHADTSTAKRRETFKKARKLHTKATTTRAQAAGQAASKSHGQIVKFRRAALAFGDAGDERRAGKARKKAWKAHTKWKAAEKVSREQDEGIKSIYHRIRGRLAQRTVDKHQTTMKQHRDTATAIGKRDRPGAEQHRKKSWAAHSKWQKASAKMHYHKARSESYAAMDDFVVQLIQFRKRKKRAS